uniref:Metal Ion (Mn2 iron) Transporter (Nramp) Family put n=1 Tax=Albugo laibachii Nc14 TaxID=890382 RepID=F0W551_9STRA|nr:Metal Ion (Mn2 iron) Transporter (Nramp) Family put [Albugo laibachii Nc14]|eukprot:CCA16242.1 Metal Ion (Mn2 iron) Transporter (Nramp) Family put [Albugo laibachii Nc14]
MHSWKTLWAFTGPGWLMSIAYVDPGNLESDLQAGAYAGFQLIWVLFGATVMGFYLQILAVRLGVVTGKNLAEMCTAVYPRWASFTLWIMTEIAIVGSDIQEVLGSAIALQILFQIPLWIGCLITAFDTFTFLLLHRYGIRKLEAFFVFLLAIMLICFCANFYQSRIQVSEIMDGFVPKIRTYAMTQAVGIVGAVIMPHNLFLHSALVRTRKVHHHKVQEVRMANLYFTIEAGVALFVSFLINLAVLGVFSQGFFSPDCLETYKKDRISSSCIPGRTVDGPVFRSCTLSNGISGWCQPIGLSQAGRSLKGMLGDYAEIIWAIGLLAAGQSSTMTGTYAGQFVMEGFLNIRLSPCKRVALTRCVALIPAMVVAILSQYQPQSSDKMDELLNVLQSIQLPFALLPLLVFTSSRNIMGEIFVNNTAIMGIGWIIGLLICVINLYLVLLNLTSLHLDGFTLSGLVVLGCMYFYFLAFLIRSDMRSLFQNIRTCALYSR